MRNPPTTLSERTALLKAKSHLLRSPGPKGKFLRNVLKETENELQVIEERQRSLDPLAFFKPSFEQSLILNSWLWGIQFIGIYTANRIGKTTACLVNIHLWIFPNKESHFKPGGIHYKYRVGQEGYDDSNAKLKTKGKLVHVLPRPDATLPPRIAKYLAKHNLEPNPREPYDSETNAPILQRLQEAFPELKECLKDGGRGAYPYAPFNHGGEIWIGAPDQKHHENKILPMLKKLLPAQAIDRYAPTEREVGLKIVGERRTTYWNITGLSFESKETKWSSGAVAIIVLTEGVSADIFGEVKARFTSPGYGSHDFTPYEPANAGHCTAVAQQISRGQLQLPLPTYCFEDLSVLDAPDYIIDDDKRAGMLKAYGDTPEGQARLYGKFYSSSGLILDNYHEDVHLIEDLTIEELFERFPRAQIYRGLDPGYDHPTACAWGLLLETNQWIIYRILSERGMDIPTRCKKIIETSGNEQEEHERAGMKYYRERPKDKKSEIVMATFMDYHAFEADQVTGQSMSLNYIQHGLIVSESIHTGPEDRAIEFNAALKPSRIYPNQIDANLLPPGPKVYFLAKGPGVVAFLQKMQNFYWERYRGGPKKGLPTDKIPTNNDDELDAICYLVCSKIRWTNVRLSGNIVTVRSRHSMTNIEQGSDDFDCQDTYIPLKR